MMKFAMTGLCLWALLGALPAGALEPGEPAPDYTWQALDNAAGETVSLDDYVGMLVYVDFWASWCGPCRQSFPALESIRQTYHEEGFEVLAVNLDDELADAEHFLQRFEVSYPVLRDPSKQSPERYGVMGMPSAYLVDQAGVVRQVHLGFRQGDAERIEQQVRELLGLEP